MGRDAGALVLELGTAARAERGAAPGTAGRCPGTPRETGRRLPGRLRRAVLPAAAQGGGARRSLQPLGPCTRQLLCRMVLFEQRHVECTGTSTHTLDVQLQTQYYLNMCHVRMQVRFLFPVLPLFNVLAAAGYVRLAQNRRKSLAWAGAHAAAVAALAATLAATALMTAASRHNYPGGNALARLHALEAAQADAALQQGAHTGFSTLFPLHA